MKRHEHVRDYITLSECYDRLNKGLFSGQLPGCVLTFEDKGQNFGHYRHLGYVSRDGKTRKDEICLNPRHFLTNTGDLELLQTLAHEMCHQWQYHFGKHSRAGYHNKEWGTRMESIGLVPSSTGEPGGRKTGQCMADYPQERGRFLIEAKEILQGRELIRYYKREVFQRKAFGTATGPEPAWEQAAGAYAETEGTVPVPDSKPPLPSKLKYSCPECRANAWGKPGLKLICGACWDVSNPVRLVLA